MTPRAPRAAAACAALSLAVAGCAHRGSDPAWPARLQKDVTFTRYTPLSRSEEIVRRITTPVAFRRAQALLAAQRKALRDQPVDLARERFAVYVPAGAPPARGYGLLVFVPPWPDATEPKRWRGPLDRHGLIFVAAARSGNESDVYERRLPLALLAYENVRAQYRIDPERVYVGGLSGGSRVAEVAALAYPDVFRGALLNAGSEPIGGAHGLHLPPRDLFRRFQEARLVYVTGGKDEGTLESDLLSQQSMRSWCVLDVDVLVAQRLGHEPLDAASLDRALDALERRSSVDPAELARCREGVERELSARLAAAEGALARGDGAAARSQVDAIDAHYGGLAAPALLDLDARIGPRD